MQVAAMKNQADIDNAIYKRWLQNTGHADTPGTYAAFMGGMGAQMSIHQHGSLTKLTWEEALDKYPAQMAEYRENVTDDDPNVTYMDKWSLKQFFASAYSQNVKFGHIGDLFIVQQFGTLMYHDWDDGWQPLELDK